MLNCILSPDTSIVFIQEKYNTNTLILTIKNRVNESQYLERKPSPYSSCSHCTSVHTSRISHTWPQSHCSWWLGHRRFLTLLQVRQCTAWLSLHSEGTVFLKTNIFNTDISLLYHAICRNIHVKVQMTWMQRQKLLDKFSNLKTSHVQVWNNCSSVLVSWAYCLFTNATATSNLMSLSYTFFSKFESLNLGCL